MAQLKVKQISDFVAAVGTIHNGVVGTGTATAIGTAKSEAISSAISADVVVLSSAKSYADVAESDAVATANGYTDGREIIINQAFADADIVIDGNAKGYASDAEANAVATASADATSKANDAEANAISTAVVNGDLAYDRIGSADAALVSAKSYSDIQKGRIDALLLDSQGTLDTFKEISDFITTLDTADIDGLTAAISTGDSTALSSAISADVVVLSSAKSYADVAEADAVTESTRLGNLAYDKIGSAATAEANASAYADGLAVNYDGVGSADAALVSAKAYADTAESDAIASANGYTDTKIAALDLDLQGQIDTLSGVNSDEVIALFVNKTSFDAGKVFNLNGGHVAVFVNGLQIHEAAEGVDGWRSANGQLFTVEGLGYDLEGDDHIVVSGTLA